MKNHRTWLLSAGFVAVVFGCGLTADAFAAEACRDIEEWWLWLECVEENCEDTSCCVEACDCDRGGVGGGEDEIIWDVGGTQVFDVVPLDFSAPLPDATGLSVSWTGTATQGLVEICDSLGNCRVEPYDARVGVRLQDDAGEWPAGILISTFDPGIPTTRSLFPLGGPEVWDSLRDGVVDIRFDALAPPAGPGETVTVLTPATGQLDMDWTAKVEGVSVPGLSGWGVTVLAALLLIAGLTAVVRRRPAVA